MDATTTQNPAAPLELADLGARVYVDHVPAGAADELPDLYGSLFSTELWFRAVDHALARGVCVLDEPRHLLFYTVSDDTVDVLNKVFPIAPADARRACEALFLALPQARRVHLEVPFEPHELGLPDRALQRSEDMVVDLPGSVDEYKAMLSSHTRKNLRNYENRLRRRDPDIVTAAEVTAGGDPQRLALLIDTFARWNRIRFRDKRATSSFEEPDKVAELTTLVREAGEALVTTIGGKLAAIEFLFYVGDDACNYAGSFDDDYADAHLGVLSTYWTVCEAVARGSARLHMLWGTSLYKAILGARPVAYTRLSVYRSTSAKIRALDESAAVARRSFDRWVTLGMRRYHGARHSVRLRLDKVAGRPKQTTPPGET